MLRITFMLMSLVAVVGVSALASASAMAVPHWLVCLKVEAGKGKFAESECKTEGGNKEWEAKELPSVLKIEGTSGLADLKTEIGSTAVTVTCAKDRITGTIEAPGNSEATIKYEACSIVGAAECRVPNITANVLDRLVEKAGVIEDEFYEVPGSGEFTTVTIEVCALKSKTKVTGTQKCGLPEGEVFKRLHEINCLASGSTLKFGSKTATYEGKASIQLEDHDAFRASK